MLSWRGTTAANAWGARMGTVIMLGTLLGLIVLVFGLVLRYDPEARGSSEREDAS